MILQDLPRICLFADGKAEPVVYDGPVKLDALASFLRDTVSGGDACVAMRQEVHKKERELEEATADAAKAREEASVKARDRYLPCTTPLARVVHASDIAPRTHAGHPEHRSLPLKRLLHVRRSNCGKQFKTRKQRRLRPRKR